MDPNATVREIKEANADLASGKMTKREHKSYVAERRAALREWRARGSFPPRGGWAAAGL